MNLNHALDIALVNGFHSVTPTMTVHGQGDNSRASTSCRQISIQRLTERHRPKHTHTQMLEHARRKQESNYNTRTITNGDRDRDTEKQIGQSDALPIMLSSSKSPR
jgi:hypothetical protein